MRVYALGYIFQAKVDKLLGGIEVVKTYIDDIIVLNKDCFRNHIGQLIIKFGRLPATGLNTNATKQFLVKGDSLTILCYNKEGY